MNRIRRLYTLGIRTRQRSIILTAVIAKAAGIASTAPPSRQISQDNLRRWEKSAREASITCNQAAAFNRCIYKVQDNMQTQLKVVKSELSKGKSSERVSQAASKLQFLLNFNSSITQAMAKTLGTFDRLCICHSGQHYSDKA